MSSTTHTIEESLSGFSVYPVARNVTQTTVRDGQVAIETLPFAQVFGGWRPSTFDAYYDGEDYWSTDLDCGARRWRGLKTTKEVRRALRKCGFSTQVVNELIVKHKGA